MTTFSSNRYASVSEAARYAHISPYLDKGYPCVISGISTVWEEARAWGVEKHLMKGQVFSFDDENTTNFVYVKSGTVHCIFYEGNGASRTNLICKAGALINETCTVTQSISSKVLFECRTPVTLYYFSGELPFNNRFIADFPHLIKNMFLSSATKLLHIQALLNAVCTRNKLHLVCWYIYSMVMHHQGKTYFFPYFSQTDICALLGLSKSSMKRSMGYLKEEGIVTQFTKHHLVVEDLPRLAELAMPGS